MNTDKIVNALPHIFVGVGMAFGATATVEGIRSTFEMCEDGYDRSYFADKNVELKEKIATAGRYHWKTGLATAAAGVCFAGSVKGYSSQIAMAGAATYWKKYAKEYRLKNRELYGAENDKEIERSIASDHISQKKPPKKIFRDPECLAMFDPITEQYFEVTPAELDFAERSMNDILSKGCPVHYWYFLKHFRGVNWDLPICEDFGWHLDDTYEDYHYYNESFFGHTMFRILKDDFEDTQYGRIYILRCNPEPMLNLDMDDIEAVKDSQELHCL